jgi:hypothetical protein
VKVATRFRIVGVEVIGLGAYLLVMIYLGVLRGEAGTGFQSLGWEYGIAGVTLILVGLEILHLIKRLPGAASTEGRWR